MNLFKRKPKCKYCEYFIFERYQFSNAENAPIYRSRRRNKCLIGKCYVKGGYPACDDFKWAKKFEDKT